MARFAPLVPVTADRRVLDVACGNGRHAKLFLDAGYRVTAVDRDASGVRRLMPHPNLDIVETDLEKTGGWPFGGMEFAGVVVANYLHRPILNDIVAAVALGGALIYETFAVGNERFGRPRNPDFLLEAGELLRATRGKLRVAAYEHGETGNPRPAVIQRIAAIRRNRDGPPGREPDSP